MKSLVRSGLCVTQCLGLLATLLSLSIPQAGAATPRERKFEFEYKATVRDIPAGAKKVDLWIPVPHDGPFQAISSMRVDSPYPYQVREAQYGNKVLHISLNDPQQRSFTVTMRFEALRREHIQERLQTASYPAAPAAKEKRDPNLSRWLQPDRLVP